MNNWKTIKKVIAYQSKWTTLRADEVQKPDGSKDIYNFIDSHPSVFIVPVTPEGKICFINLFRYPQQGFSWELPGGRTDGVNPQKIAKQELQEELGAVSNNWQEIGWFYPINGLTNEKCVVFLASKINFTVKDDKEEENIINTKQLTLKEANDWIQNGKIHDGQTIAALALARPHLE